MRLRRIEIQGFKSFREKVSVELSDGMTAIVGPNGCGKSNIVDALKWAMGDMSAKSLRGKNLSDMIFAGSEHHKAMGMAEVTLTFANPLHEDEDRLREVEGEEGALEERLFGDSVPREYRHLPEISITRRLFASGDSEYLINRTACRLMDIQNLLAGTGLGKQGYSIIEQGQVGMLVTSKPDDRRLLIEEASGITRYKAQRERTEKRLAKTQDNLQRAVDVLEEVGKQVKSLERQAARAREHRELTEELTRLEVAELLRRRAQAGVERAALEQRLREARGAEESARQRLELRGQAFDAARVEASLAERTHVEATEAFYKLEARSQLARGEHQKLVEQGEEAQRRSVAAAAQRRAEVERRAGMEQELVRIERELARLGEVTAEEESLGSQALALDAARAGRRAVEEERGGLRARLDEARTAEARLEDRVAWVERQRGDLQERRRTLEGVVEEAEEECEDLRRELNRLIMDEERARADREEARGQLQRAQATLEAARTEAGAARLQRREATARRVELETRVGGLEALTESAEGYAEGVSVVRDWARREHRTDVLGPLGDFLRIEEAEEARVAAFLGERLGDVVVVGHRAALDALAQVRQAEAGRLGFFVVSPEAAASPRAAVEALLESLARVDRLEEIVGEGGLGETAFAGGRAVWVTPQGDVLFADGRVVGGKGGQAAQALLRRARELGEARRGLEEAAGWEQEATERDELAGEDLALAEDRLEEARQRVQALEGQALKAAQERAGADRELERAGRHLERARAELEPLGGLEERLQAELRDLGEQLQVQAVRQPPLLQALEEIEARLQQAQRHLEVEQEAYTDAKVRLAAGRERHRALTESRTRLVGGIERAGQEDTRLEREAREQEQRRDRLEVSAVEALQEAERLRAEFEAARAGLGAARARHEQSSGAVRQGELEQMEARRGLDGAVEAVRALEMKRHEQEVTAAALEEKLGEGYGLEIEQARALAAGVTLDPHEWGGRVGWLKRRLGGIGQVNPLAEEEWAEAQERYELLRVQREDLEQAVADLRAAIGRMDRESRKRFRETFEAVDQTFREIFPRLFRGGRARLVLTDPDDLLNTGVEIEAQPPGKRPRNLSLLSGGEKALTAAALIFSIMLLKPAPFSVLDEVDAPLDEANIGRFAEMVQSLGGDSQFLVITHRRPMMQACEMLYGVTMEEPGCSKVVGVRLSEIDEKLAS